MRRVTIAVALVASMLLAGCEDEAKAPPPAPFALTSEAIGRYCGMNVLEHPGPKGQIILDAQVGEPIWFSSARDAIAFTMLPEEPKDVAAIYVSDMAKAPSWEEPGATNWVDARKAFFVLGSRMRGGMGSEEAVPFSTKDAASRFASENGGRVVIFADVPREYVLGGSTEAADATSPAEDKPKEDDNGQNL